MTVAMLSKRFGRLVVVSQAPTQGRQLAWNCACDCGGRKVAQGSNLRRGLTASCGCLQRESSSASARTHGLSKTRLYVVWRNMMARCSNPNDSRYGGRGITVCERWQDFASFHADMGSPPSPRYTLDRIDVNGNYEHGNCRWATPTEQARNKASNRIISYQGLDLSLAAHCERVGIPYKTAHQRLQRGWAVEQALSLTT